MNDNVHFVHGGPVATSHSDVGPEHLKKGGGGGNFDGMEPRITRLETRIDKIDDRLRGVEVNLATLNERVAHLPGKGFIVTALMTSVAAASGLIGLIVKWPELVSLFTSN